MPTMWNVKSMLKRIFGADEEEKRVLADELGEVSEELEAAQKKTMWTWKKVIQ